MDTEQYMVKYKIQREDGYWEQRYEDVFVPLKKNENEKRNHDLARKQFQQKNPKAVVLYVTYC